jgi:adenine-specific DNA-methyltransferase
MSDDKLKMHSPDLTQDNLAKIRAAFPGCVTEARDENGKLKLAVDFDLLRQELSDHIVEGPQERYQLNWPGKREALITANAPIAKTLRPAREESMNFDTTRNLFIEGDNLDALKLLQETYLGKVKMIYIDPPYNTGNDFIYEDDFAETNASYLVRSNQKDHSLNRLIANTETNGKFHSDWLSMIYPRLRTSKKLLTDDGVIFISIDDNEIANLISIVKEIFGEANLIATLVWEKKKKGTFLSGSVSSVKEYIVVAAKDRVKFSGLIGEINSEVETYPCINSSNKRDQRVIPAGLISKYREKDFFLPAGHVISVSTMDIVLQSDLIVSGGRVEKPVVMESNWRYTQTAMDEFAEKEELYLTQDLYLRRIVSEARHKTLKDLLPRVGEDTGSSFKAINIENLFADGWGSNEDGAEELRQILSTKGALEYPKPRKLVEKLCASIRDNNCIVLDFFAGSATTGHAVIDLNSLDGGQRRFILVQLPEVIENLTVRNNVIVKTIADLAKERLRYSGEVLSKNECHPDWNKDVGFRVLKIDTSNMRDVYYAPEAIKQEDLLGAVENIKPDRTPEDLLFQVLVDWGVDLTLPITRQSISGKTVFFVDENALVACFDQGISEELVTTLTKHKPLRAVFRDTGLARDDTKINIKQIFRQLSPGTDVKSI